MTDAPPAPKPLSVRCPGCKTLIFNETLNVNMHKLLCPQDMKMRQQKFEDRLTAIERALNGIGEKVSAEPAVDLQTVGEWPDDDDEPLDQEAVDEEWPEELPVEDVEDEDEPGNVLPVTPYGIR